MTIRSAPTTLFELLAAGNDDAPAIGAPGSKPMPYVRLRALVENTVAQLNAHGVGRGDRIAIVLDNGPEMAATFLAAAASAAAAPLNPAYRTDEFEFYLSDLRPKLLILDTTTNSPALAVAERLGIALARIEAMRTVEAGLFRLRFPDTLRPRPRGGAEWAQTDDIALVLHTSGTTSRPKIVPLRQRNICASARNVGEVMALGPNDRGLNIMPLFHIHGLIAGVLAPLSRGGEVCCTEGFNGLRFFQWLDAVKPSWYTAVPTMHQAILARGARNDDILKRTQLRFLRSSSASLPPQVLHALEALFRAPVLEAYGMTEAAHQMASNPLPPRQRKPGSVGIAVGCQLTILDEFGASLPAGSIGEIAIQGDNVMESYEANAAANAEAFINGWFRTGDQGVMDEDGYITITGRLKEIINRGGEKVSPREVDEVLMDHPAVAQCVTFAVPHAKLGEDVAAAVVLQEGQHVNERELCAFAALKLAAFKVPRTIVFLAEIPKGATGKLQRIGLAHKLGLA
jgi:oxalate---CoA ligase